MLGRSEWQVASQQQLVQSFYEEADRAVRHGETLPQMRDRYAMISEQ